MKALPTPHADDMRSRGAKVFQDMTDRLYDLRPAAQAGAADDEAVDSPYEERLRRQGRAGLVGL